ncbi:Wall-associated kinase family protein [Rhynchospora pubera]|uniref:Wall-associated kinase family protein n=1 Tax=Rhynchospora pubera TaxID=906938 RepID=A0AAV8DCV5_9POAL|nr:Wall-associated kinase family protein [Rhynchospora pubera]
MGYLLFFNLAFLTPALVLLLLIGSSSSSVSQLVQLQPQPGCPTQCGDVEVAYPFGIGKNCGRSEQFQFLCKKNDYGKFKPFVPDSDIEVRSILVSEGLARIRNPVSRLCYNSTTGDIFFNVVGANLTYTPFWLSNTQNRFTVIGSNVLAYIILSGTKSAYRAGCMALRLGEQRVVNGSCSGIGCCEATIPFRSKFYLILFDLSDAPISSFNICRYAVFTETDNFKFSTSYITTPGSFQKDAINLSVVLDWTVGTETCKLAQRNRTSYACVSSHSTCVNYSGLGYRCICVQGYQGNPYVLGGCQDIDECLDMSKCYGICTNTLGSFKCDCPPGTHGNGSLPGDCYKNGPKIQLWGKLLIGFSISILVVLLSSSLVYWVYHRRKVATIKHKYFQQYGGHLLLEEMKSKQGFSFRLFSEEELKEATNNFDEKNVAGEGGNGTVYKGTLNNRFVAIKKCKTIGERERKEFGKEILILSQINHKNIVRILGCCLEVEIPILVYEFISEGTLFDLLHGKHASYIPLRTRLRIAQEAAEALVYLHSWASPPIVHCDVKSSNILLDENFVVKVSDFGASVLASGGEDQFVTHVQGTRGYLDPEYILTGQLTVKSDVYSFGVVIIELLTRKKAFYFEALEARCLTADFLSAMKENNIATILDDEIAKDGGCLDLITNLMELVRVCIHMEAEKRPEMRQVAAALDASIRALENFDLEANEIS